MGGAHWMGGVTWMGRGSLDAYGRGSLLDGRDGRGSLDGRDGRDSLDGRDGRGSLDGRGYLDGMLIGCIWEGLIIGLEG